MSGHTPREIPNKLSGQPPRSSAAPTAQPAPAHQPAPPVKTAPTEIVAPLITGAGTGRAAATSAQAAWRDEIPAAIPLAVPGIASADPPSDVLADGLPKPPQLPLDELPPEDVRWQDDRAPRTKAIADSMLDGAPPWLASTMIHMLAMLVLGLCLMPSNAKELFTLELNFSSEQGDQLEDAVLDMADFSKEADAIEQALVLEDLPEVTNPLATPPPIDMHPDDIWGNVAAVQAPTIGIALAGREVGMKEALLSAYGGNASTEAAVMLGLEWLARQQVKHTGGWSLKGPYRDGCPAENREAATAMALLAFQGAGHTHKTGKHQQVVARGWDFLLRRQDSNGSIFQGQDNNHRLYTHAQATIALCELYGMTKDEALRVPAQAAIDYAVKIQDRRGGWRYTPGRGSDTSVTGWFVMAFQSALMAGLEVPSPTLSQVSDYLDSVSSENGARYAYRHTHPPTVAMTAEALLCRQYLGWQRDDPRLLSGVKYVLNNPITYREPNIYYWYYATQVLHHMEGPAWKEWNKVMRDEIPKHQVREGRERGSWDPTEDQWGLFGGRLFTTALSVYTLEVYYRHLPIYGFHQ